MRAIFAAPMFLGMALALSAQAPPDPEKALAKARANIIDRTERLPNYTCVQTVDRKFLKLQKPVFPIPSCGDMSAKTTGLLAVEATDRLRLDVQVSGGKEIGAWAGGSHFDEGNVISFIKGPFGTGGFGNFLTDIFTSSGITLAFEGEERLGSLNLLRYRFRISRESSHYMVRAGSEWLATGYSGEVWIDPKSSELRRLLVQTSELPEETGACVSNSTVEYATTRIGTGDFLLPQRSTLHFQMRDMTESEVATIYSRCHQFHGEANLVADPSVTAGREAQAAPTPISIPAGLVVPLKLVRAIDTDSAAAGDAVVATVSEAVRDPKSNEIVIPARSMVQGRILRMEHSLDVPRRFVIVVQLETVEIHGIPSPFYAILLRDDERQAAKNAPSALVERSHQIILPPRGESPLAADFLVTSKAKHYVLPRGREMQWLTVPAPESPRP
jgi:hypothetical protein